MLPQLCASSVRQHLAIYGGLRTAKKFHLQNWFHLAELVPFAKLVWLC